MQCLQKTAVRPAVAGRRAVLVKVAEADAPAAASAQPKLEPPAVTPVAEVKIESVKPVAEKKPEPAPAPAPVPAAAPVPAPAPVQASQAAQPAQPAQESLTQTQAPLTPAEWVPEAALPLLGFFNAQDVRLGSVVEPITNSGLYETYLKEFVESQTAKDTFGWKPLPETINGRAAMLGFFAAAGAELLGQGSVVSQLSGAGLPVLLTLATVAVSSVVPVYLGSKGEYLDSLREVYSLPQGWFTEANERVHGRLAMLGLGSLIALELIMGHKLL